MKIGREKKKGFCTLGHTGEYCFRSACTNGGERKKGEKLMMLKKYIIVEDKIVKYLFLLQIDGAVTSRAREAALPWRPPRARPGRRWIGE